MSLGNILASDNQQTVEKANYIEITKKTVRFGASVYQWINVTGFRLAKVKSKWIFPFGLILIVFLLGLTLANIPSMSSWGFLAILLSLVAIVLNIIQPKRYGLELSLNSSERKFFITEDLEGVKNIVKTLYDFMESDRDSIYTFNIDQRHAKIVDQRHATMGVGYSEKTEAKKIGGTINEARTPTSNGQNPDRY